MTTIPASEIVRVIPGVLAAGGSAFTLNGLMLTTSIRPPIGAVPSFPDAESVADYFGSSSTEKAMADVYFNGFENSTKKPGALLFAQYNEDAVAAYIRGGSLATMTLSELQGLNQALAITVDGIARDGGTINLSGASSFSTAADLIQTALNADIDTAAEFTGSIAGTTLTVTAVSSGTLAAGLVVSGTAAGLVTAGTFITAQVSGSVGGTGVYSVSTTQTVGSQSMVAEAAEVAVTFDSVSSGFIITSGITGALSTIAFATGSMSTSLKLTEVTGAVLSQGAAAATPEGRMDEIVAITQNWALFTTLFDPDDSGNTNKLAFAEWTNDQGDRYGYVPWDTNEAAAASAPADSSLGMQVQDAEYSGTAVVYDPTAGSLAAFVLGVAASIDFTQPDGRITFAFRRQSGLTPSATTAAEAQNLIANGYNFYGAYGAAADEFRFFQKGTVSGDFTWLDSYVNQIWLNNALQIALLNLLQNANSVPYNAAGNSMIEAALNDAIQAALTFGAIRAGVTLSSSQAASVNAAAGVRASDVLATRGWYLLIGTASAEVRAARQSPPATFWYMDGQSVQEIELSSINVQ